jgi:hypothetical protein
MRRVKSNGSSLRVLLDRRFPVEVSAVQNRPVEQVLETRLEVADQVPRQEHVLGFAPSNVAMPHEDDTVLGERPRLVGAQHVHGSEVLDGVKPLDDYLLAAHGERAI